MLAKGIIQSINFSSNTCIVRVPLFETAGNEYKCENESIFSIPPGVFNGYKVGDVVIVGFDAGNEGYPIILGKLYTGANDESKITGGAGQFNDLIVTNSAKLPANIEINFDQDSKNKAITSEVALSNYKSLRNIVDAVIKNSNEINKINTNLTNISNFQINEQQVGWWANNKAICQKTIVYSFIEDDLGQSLNNEHWSKEIDLSNLDALIIHEDEVNGFTFITTSTGILERSQFNYQILGNKLTISGTKYSDYTLNKFYTTLRYIKK